MSKEKMYSIAVRKRLSQDDFFWNHDDYMFHECSINCEGRYWVADPFVFEKNGITYLFYEAYDLIQRRGKIGYSILKENGCASNVRIVIDEPHHLSFPNIYEKDGDIFILPETSEASNIKIYKAISFPDKWVMEKVLVDDLFTCDTIIGKDFSGKDFLLTSEMYRESVPNNNYASCWVKNVLYPLDDNMKVKGIGTLVAEGDYGIRNAGQFINKDTKVYRVGQNCLKRQYGKGIVLYEVESFDPYIENEIFAIDCNDFTNHIIKRTGNKIIGVHTYNCSEHYEIIDFSEIRDLPFKTQLIRNVKPSYKTMRHYIHITRIGLTNILKGK